jgi:hypothetical protein
VVAMKKLEDADIIRIMREEWDAKLSRLSEEVDAVLKGKVDGKEKTILSPDTKLRHKKSKILYTLVSIGPRDAILKTPEEKQFLVDKDTLEKEYAID